VSDISDGDAKANRRHNAYYVPELEMVITRYRALTADPVALDHFVKRQQAVASQMMTVSPRCKNNLFSSDCHLLDRHVVIWVG
jgi:hypothetical protein